MIADNGGAGNGSIADFRPDGTVVVTYKGKLTTTKYKREPGKKWVKRRASALGLKKQGLEQFTEPGVEMIEFADADGRYMDHGSSLLTLDPKRRVLYNIITQAWCRPGEEAKIKAAFDAK
jgi:hypothetical protein